MGSEFHSMQGELVKAMKGRQILREGAANLQKGLETVGGRLILDEQKLVFQPHSANIQREIVAIDCSGISDLKLAWTKLLGFIPVFPNAIVIESLGQEFRFTVFKRKKWFQDIKGLLAGSENNA